MTTETDLLVSTAWLADRLHSPDVRVVDGSWHMPAERRNARAEYEAGHIPGAVFFDIDKISDTASDLPHMVPPVEKFVSRVRRMGIGDGHHVVVYDAAGLFSAARVWWLFRLFGHERVSVLDGGLPKWKAEGRPLDDSPPIVRDRHLTARKDMDMVRDASQIALNVKLRGEQTVDARGPGRFAGTEPEPRPGLRSGHIPGSRNVHYATLLNPDGTMKSVDECRSVFEAAGVDLSRPVVTTCGSGVTAAILSLALERMGHARHALYDGSWAEWGAFDALPIETGPAADG
jgi:thiosulfate/3-mercaptopyruvate sulfurtransferase